jgi:hypothetical protein
VSMLAGLLLVAAPASATPLPPSVNPLPGSSFLGANGNQDNAAPFVDWQALQAAGRVRHNPDPNNEDSAFKVGSKEDEPGQWDLTHEKNGVDPAKDNILDGWSAVEKPGADTFLYLAFTRASANGTTYLAFELNQDARLWNNGNAHVPCRRTGDVLVSYQASGNEVDVILQRWVTLRTNPATGCAETGKLTDFTNLTPNVDAQGAINGGQIANYLPGFLATPGTIPSGQFGEAALNLAQLLANAFDDKCLAFRSIWMHSRSSTSESSNMQDYVAPRRLPVATCAASGTKFFDSNANGQRDPGERGIPLFLIWADYNDDGVRDDDEPFSVTDLQGQYVIYDIKPPDGTYMLRETLLPLGRRTRAVSSDWICTYPNDATPGGTGSAPGGRFPCAWGPINVNATPHARHRDFGNWFPLPGPGPEPVVPPGPKPPNAGDAAKARFLFKKATGKCISGRVPRVNFSGTRIERIRVYVNGHLIKRLTVGTLQKKVTPRVTLPPGRYRVTVKVTFQPGSGTPPLTLSRNIRICRPTPPRFTGREPRFTGSVTS